MEKNRQSKIIAIVALCVAVVGLTLGFAAFSNTLTISSSATVTPDSSDFDINVYGVENFNGDHYDLNNYTSNNTSMPVIDSGVANPAKINDKGKAVSISDISVGLIGPVDSVSYHFLIKNEGEYDAYFDTAKLDEYFGGVTGVCTPSDNVTPALVEEACDYVYIALMFEDSHTRQINSGGSYKLAKGEYMFMTANVFYNYAENSPRADGNFSVDFDDIVLEFSSVS